AAHDLGHGRVVLDDLDSGGDGWGVHHGSDDRRRIHGCLRSAGFVSRIGRTSPEACKRRAVTTFRVPDVIIPVLNEAAALPVLLPTMPAGYRPIVVDNGSTDGSGDIARAAGATVVFEGRPGFGSACWAGLVASDPADGVVCFLDGDGSLDPADLPTVAGPVLAGRADLVLGARRPAAANAWPGHARLANAVLAFELRRRTGRAAGPRPDAGRPPRRPARPRHRGPPLRLAAGDGAPGGGGGLAHRGAARPLPSPHRPLQGDRHRPRHRPGHPRHGPVAEMTPRPRTGLHVLVMAK